MYMELCAGGGWVDTIVDETGFTVNMRCRRGRAPVGRRAVHTVSALRTKNFSVCSAINEE